MSSRPPVHGQTSFQTNTLYYGDCLDWMRKWPDGCVDLIYLDPPFKSDTDYNILFGTQNGKPAQLQAFEDTWTWNEKAQERVQRIKDAVAHPAHKSITGLHFVLGGCGMLSYLSYMAERLPEMKRVLKLTGSIYLHCDPTASHYLKVVMDNVFGSDNYQNEITWKRTTSRSDGKRYGRLSDSLLFYAQRNATWKNQYYQNGLVVKGDRKIILTGPGVSRGESGRPWRGYDPAKSGRGRCWSVPKTGTFADWIDKELIPGFKSMESIHARLDALYEKGLIEFSRNGTPELFRPAAASNVGAKINDIWTDISLERAAKSIADYPTRKPRALLERIIQASSNERDIVLDPFCGCGTTIDAARRLGRQWVGIDISSFAIDLIVHARLQDRDIPVAGIPVDIASAKKLARADRLGFEKWAISKIPGFVPNEKQVGDDGIDGRATLMSSVAPYSTRLVLAQVKSGKLGDLATDVGRFRETIRNNAVCGVFITMNKVDIQKRRAPEFESMGRFEMESKDYPRLQFWSIEEYFDNRFPDLPPMLNPYTGKPMLQPPLI